jgi:hypothetical protein
LLAMHNVEMKKMGFNADEPVFVASAIFAIEQMTPGNLEKIITYSADLLGAFGDKVCGTSPNLVCLVGHPRRCCLSSKSAAHQHPSPIVPGTAEYA